MSNRSLVEFVESIVDATGPYGHLNGTQIIADAYAALRKHRDEKPPVAGSLNQCPKCGGPADNGHDRCFPPNPYYCTKCSDYGSDEDDQAEQPEDDQSEAELRATALYEDLLKANKRIAELSRGYSVMGGGLDPRSETGRDASAPQSSEPSARITLPPAKPNCGEIPVVDEKTLVSQIIGICENTEGYALTAVTLRDLLRPYLRSPVPVMSDRILKVIANTLDSPTFIDPVANCKNLTKTIQEIERICKTAK